MTCRNWVFTINNPEDLDLPTWEWMTPDVKFAIYQKECGEEGTIHLQGYVEFASAIRLPQVKRLLPRAHLEKRRGNRQQAIEYCTKLDTRVPGSEPCVFGWHGTVEELLNSFKKKKKNKSLLRMKEMIDEGQSELQLAEEDFGTWSRSFRALERYRRLKTKPRNHETEVIVIQGPTGTGKSRYALEQYPDAYWKQRSNWWDGYGTEETVIIDEFYGWLPFDLLLRLCDRYPLLVESKGGQIQMVATRVVITSNAIPSLWYKNVYFPAFIRRVSKWIVMPTLGTEVCYDNYEEINWVA